MLKAAIKAAVRLGGYRLVPIPHPTSEYAGGVVPEKANYSPWNVAPEFLDTFSKIRANTLVDIYRCWELWTLVEQTAKLAPGDILEVGVWRGGTGALMAKRAQSVALGSSVYLCDTFQGVVKAGKQDSIYVGGEHADTARDIVEALVASLALKNVKILTGIFPDDTGHVVSDNRFRLVHIDVDTYQSAKDVMTWVWDRLVPGGMVVYDDYGCNVCDGVKTAVNELAGDTGKLLLHNLNGHAIVVKTS
jgi:O-methyltransferase